MARTALRQQFAGIEGDVAGGGGQRNVACRSTRSATARSGRAGRVDSGRIVEGDSTRGGIERDATAGQADAGGSPSRCSDVGVDLNARACNGAEGPALYIGRASGVDGGVQINAAGGIQGQPLAAAPRQAIHQGDVSRTSGRDADGLHGDVVVGQGRLQRADLQEGKIMGWIGVVVGGEVSECVAVVGHPTGAGRVAYGQVGGVQQQGPVFAKFCRGIHLSSEVQMLFAGHLHQATVATRFTTLGFNRPGEAGALIGPNDDLAAIALCGGVGANHCAFTHVTDLGVGDFGVFALIVTTEQHCASAGRPRGINLAASQDAKFGARHHNLSALAASGSGVQRPSVFDNTALGDQSDGAAITTHHATRLNQATIVDGQARQLSCGLDRHEHHTAIGPNHATVLDVGLKDTLLNLYASGSPQVQAHFLSSGHQHLSAGREDFTQVLHPRCNHGHRTTVLCMDVALIDHRLPGRTCQSEIALHEVIVAHAQRGGQDGGDLYPGSRAEKNAIGIEQENTAIGDQASLNGGGVAAQHAVQRDGLCARLNKLNLLTAANIEGLPVDRHLVAGLMDGHLRRALTDLARACGHCALGR